MKKYFVAKNGKQEGPYSVKELIEMKISRDTLIWYSELNDWIKAELVAELKTAFEMIPPPIPPKIPDSSKIDKVGKSGLQPKFAAFGVVLLLLAAISAFYFFRNKNQTNLTPNSIEPAQIEKNKVKKDDKSTKGNKNNVINENLGDYNGDGVDEIMELESPEIVDGEGGKCRGGCDCRIQFSNKNIEPIFIKNCIGGKPKNEGDLNNDGSDEISIIPSWFQSGLTTLILFQNVNGKWKKHEFPFHIAARQNWTDLIRKDPKNPGYIIVVQCNDDADGHEVKYRLD